MISGEVILVAEDDENDVYLVQRACQKATIKAHLHIVKDGEQAVNYVLGKGEFADREKYPLPYLILMDIKMPRMSGLEALEIIKNDGTAKRIPVIMTSSSSLQSDIDQAYELGANAYLSKPVDFESLLAMFQMVAEFFSKHAAKPRVKTKES